MILYCSPDISHQKQMSIILWCVDVSSQIKVSKYVLEVLEVDDTTRKCILDAIVDDIDNIKGQWYDNGSNMKGKLRRVQKKLISYHFTFCVIIIV